VQVLFDYFAMRFLMTRRRHLENFNEKLQLSEAMNGALAA
jgi:hypothetical protein